MMTPPSTYTVRQILRNPHHEHRELGSVFEQPSIPQYNCQIEINQEATASSNLQQPLAYHQMKRSIGFSKNLNSLDESLPALGGVNRKHNNEFTNFNTIEADESDSDFIAQIQGPKRFQCHKSFVNYYSVDHLPTRMETAGSSSQSSYRKISKESRTALPELPFCDFLSTGCARFDSILSLKENESKKRCIVTAHPPDEILFERSSSLFIPSKISQLTINLKEVNLISQGLVATEPGCSPNSIAVINEETGVDYTRKQMGIEVHCPLIVPPLCTNSTTTTSLRNDRSTACPRVPSLVK